MTIPPQSHTHQPFSLVLGGGGARGFAHVGVLRALEAYGFYPDAVVGVSMGAVVGVTYALRRDWYRALLDMDTSAFPEPFNTYDDPRPDLPDRMRTLLVHTRAVKDLFANWGMGTRALEAGKATLRTLTAGRTLEEACLPVAVSTTDLRSGHRYVLRSGDAAEAMYASSALAGVLPPLKHNGRMLADGVYSDIAPVDVARTFGHPVVLAVDPGQELISSSIRNGYQALMRALEVCHHRHADMRFNQADLVLRPPFRRIIDTLDFGARRECIAAGIRVVRQHRHRLDHLLTPYIDSEV